MLREGSDFFVDELKYRESKIKEKVFHLKLEKSKILFKLAILKILSKYEYSRFKQKLIEVNDYIEGWELLLDMIKRDTIEYNWKVYMFIKDYLGYDFLKLYEDKIKIKN